MVTAVANSSQGSRNLFWARKHSEKNQYQVVSVGSFNRAGVYQRHHCFKNIPEWTRRVNGFDEIGAMPSCFIFFEETADSGVYDVWWNEDKAIVAATYDHWEQGQNSQHGSGRLAIVVPSPVERNLLQV